MGSPTAPEAIVDTVVLRYFLLANEITLLFELLGTPTGVPRIVYDDDEVDDMQPTARSEITHSIAFQRQASRDLARDQGDRDAAADRARKLSRMHELTSSGQIVIVDMTSDELAMVGRFTSRDSCAEFGLRFPLQAGEAACVAIGVQRGLVVVTDDNDALRALGRCAPGHPYERIRKLLIRSVSEERCSPQRANEIHAAMRASGFWDNRAPFPTL